jgi:FKBP-type peptidyl-prolyl cis-trans isomerase
MAVGDSAEFQFSTDSLFLKTFKAKSIPNFVHSGTMLTFDVKLVKFQTEAQLKEEQQKQMAMQQAEMGKRKSDEQTVISKYLSDNKITVNPTADGIYLLQDTPGTGRAVADGDSVEVRYKGMFLDGKIFDQSSAHGGKGTFTFQYSQHASLIQGWIKVIGVMHEGEKVTVLIPSSMGYGERGAGGLIQPFTPLLFDIEVVKLSK